MAMRRIEDEARAHGRAGRRPAAAGPARPGPAARARARRPARAGRRRRRRRPRPSSPTGRSRSTPNGAGRRDRRRARGCARCSTTCWPTPAPTRRPARRSTVRVARRRATPVVEVADDGPGIDAEDGRPGLRALLPGRPVPRHAPSGGTGLGLAIVAGVAEAHGGRAGVDSTPGAGATFWVELPVAYSADGVMDACAGATISPLVGSASSSIGGRGSPAAW